MSEHEASSNTTSQLTEVDQILLNADLRTRLERFYDESIIAVNTTEMSTSDENEFLHSMLAWELAPIIPIGQWFEPELQLPAQQSLDDDQLKALLTQTIDRLFEHHVVLENTGHLSDRQLYCLIVRDILPEQEKKFRLPGKYLHWNCIDEFADDESWLRFYASDFERQQWHEETGLKLPPRERLPFPRKLPEA